MLTAGQLCNCGIVGQANERCCWFLAVFCQKMSFAGLDRLSPPSKSCSYSSKMAPPSGLWTDSLSKPTSTRLPHFTHKTPHSVASGIVPKLTSHIHWATPTPQTSSLVQQSLPSSSLLIPQPQSIQSIQSIVICICIVAVLWPMSECCRLVSLFIASFLLLLLCQTCLAISSLTNVGWSNQLHQLQRHLRHLWHQCHHHYRCRSSHYPHQNQPLPSFTGVVRVRCEGPDIGSFTSFSASSLPSSTTTERTISPASPPLSPRLTKPLSSHGPNNPNDLSTTHYHHHCLKYQTSSPFQCLHKCCHHRKPPPPPIRPITGSTTSIVFSLCLLLLQSFSGPSLVPLVGAVTVTEVHIMSIHSGRSDYVVQGESAQLSCHYVFSKQYERVVAVNWKKDGQEVYFSTPNKRPIALSLFRGHVDYNSLDLLNTVTLFDVDLTFAGQYSCRVITELNESENTASMTVIVDACKDSNWKTKTDMVNCVEEISFHCVGMFPKPSPACSIHNDDTDQYFAGETFDMIEKLPNRTYEIAIQRRYHAANFSQFAGQLSFHCHLLVLMTSWRMGIKYKLFGESGCVKPPPEINNGTSLIIGEQTCWGTPKENSHVNYSCYDGFQLMGPSVLICRNGTWIPDPINLMSQPVSDIRTYATLKLRMPYCHTRNTSSGSTLKGTVMLMLLFWWIHLLPSRLQL